MKREARPSNDLDIAFTPESSVSIEDDDLRIIGKTGFLERMVFSSQRDGPAVVFCTNTSLVVTETDSIQVGTTKGCDSCRYLVRHIVSQCSLQTPQGGFTCPAEKCIILKTENVKVNETLTASDVVQYSVSSRLLNAYLGVALKGPLECAAKIEGLGRLC